MPDGLITLIERCHSRLETARPASSRKRLSMASTFRARWPRTCLCTSIAAARATLYFPICACRLQPACTRTTAASALLRTPRADMPRAYASKVVAARR